MSRTIMLFLSFLMTMFSASASDICQMPEHLHMCEGNLGIPRESMPQFEDSNVLTAFLGKLTQDGFSVSEQTIPSSMLNMSQKEASIISISKGLTRNPCDRPVVTVYDNEKYWILDGHHGGLACRMLDGQQKSIVIRRRKWYNGSLFHNVFIKALNTDGVKSGFKIRTSTY